MPKVMGSNSGNPSGNKTTHSVVRAPPAHDPAPFAQGKPVPHILYQGGPSGRLTQSLQTEEDAQENNRAGKAHGHGYDHRKEHAHEHDLARAKAISTHTP